MDSARLPDVPVAAAADRVGVIDPKNTGIAAVIGQSIIGAYRGRVWQLNGTPADTGFVFSCHWWEDQRHDGNFDNSDR